MYWNVIMSGADKGLENLGCCNAGMDISLKRANQMDVVPPRPSLFHSRTTRNRMR